MTTSPGPRWQFWIDRGGTFTDVVARRHGGRLSGGRLGSGTLEQWSWHDASNGPCLQALEIHRPDSSKLLDLESFHDVAGKIDEIVDHHAGTSPRSNGVDYSCDGLGRLESVQYAGGGSAVFTYSSIGNLASRNDSPMVCDPVRPHQVRSGGRPKLHEKESQRCGVEDAPRRERFAGVRVRFDDDRRRHLFRAPADSSRGVLARANRFL